MLTHAPYIKEAADFMCLLKQYQGAGSRKEAMRRNGGLYIVCNFS